MPSYENCDDVTVSTVYYYVYYIHIYIYIHIFVLYVTIYTTRNTTLVFIVTQRLQAQGFICERLAALQNPEI